MEENKETEQGLAGQGLITRIFDSLSQKIVLIIAIVLVALVVGFVFDKVRKHSYVVSENVLYTAQNTAVLIDDGNGNMVIKENDTLHINAARKYFTTVADFFKTGVVVDRAEYYYLQYLNYLEENNLQHSDSILNVYIDTINGKYITDLKIGSCKNKMLTLTLHNGSKVDYKFIEKDNGGLKFYDGTGNVTLYRYQEGVHEEDNTIDYLQYTNSFEPYNVSVHKNKTHNIAVSNIGVSYDTNENYNYTVTYEDSVLNSGRIKVKMIALAANQELKILRYASQPANDPVEYKYFGTVAINLEDMGLTSSKLDFSTRRTVFIFGVAGLLLSFLVVYILSIIDTTVASRQDVEKLTGTPLLAYIEDVKKEEEK